MTQYQVEGMTCGNCVNTVKGKISGVDGVESVDVDLNSGVASIEGSVELVDLQKALAGQKYHIHDVGEESSTATASSLSRLYPLFLVFAFLLGSVLINQWLSGTWNMRIAMLNFMGGFFVVFSFFKLLDLRGFVDSFRTYDPVAKRVEVYAWMYPFIELLLGVALFTLQDLTPVYIATILILGATTIGVARVLLNKQSIQCACLGTVFDLPMTKVTLIENSVMIVMAVGMLL